MMCRALLTQLLNSPIIRLSRTRDCSLGRAVTRVRCGCTNDPASMQSDYRTLVQNQHTTMQHADEHDGKHSESANLGQGI